MWVVKVGGSLARDEALPRWLDVLAAEGRGRAIIVPGGGPFADEVRRAQDHWRFGDAVAHHMALLAMEQYGLLLHGLRSDLVPVATQEEVRRALGERRTPIWMPCAWALVARELVSSWDVTSDSLAAWLAGRLGATHLVLVKCVTLNGGAVSARCLQKAGIVDRAFPSFLEQSSFATLLLGPAQEGLLPKILRGQTGGTVVYRSNEEEKAEC